MEQGLEVEAVGASSWKSYGTARWLKERPGEGMPEELEGCGKGATGDPGRNYGRRWPKKRREHWLFSALQGVTSPVEPRQGRAVVLSLVFCFWKCCTCVDLAPFVRP